MPRSARVLWPLLLAEVANAFVLAHPASLHVSVHPSAHMDANFLPDGTALVSIGVTTIAIARAQHIFFTAVSPLQEKQKSTAVVLAFLLAYSSPPANAIVVLPKSKEQVEASASRARALSANPALPITAAQRGIDALLADEEAFRAVVTMGLPTGPLQMPPALEKGVFLNLELSATDPAALRAAAQAYMLEAAKADENLTYAEGAQLQGDSESIRTNLDAAFAAVRKCQASLQRVLAEVPAASR